MKGNWKTRNKKNQLQKTAILKEPNNNKDKNLMK